MKIPFLKLNRENKPSSEVLRRPIFNAEKLWFIALSIAIVILIITMIVGLHLFSLEYFESYKTKVPSENFDSLINVSRLKNVIEKRNELINQEISLPRDPSI